MYSQIIKVKNVQGFHARPAASFVHFCQKYDADINLRYRGHDVCAKSIINVLSAEILNGSEIELFVEGKNEKRICHEIMDFMESMEP